MRRGLALFLISCLFFGLISCGSSDSSGNSSDNSSDNSSEEANQPPLAIAGSDRTVNIGDVVTLDGTASSDADGDTIEYDWTMISIPTGSAAVILDETLSQPSFTADTAGEYIVELIVNDGTEDSVADEVTITAGFAPPSGYVLVNFRIDDTSSPITDPGYAWKGSFNFTSTTRILTHDGSWGGPFPMLYDDGPWNTGGHEPSDAVAGDNIWGVTVWVASPASALMFEYGAISGSVDGSDGDWIWIGSSNGTFTIPAGATASMEADGLILP
jgi:hypothetical protein